jgi:epoxyqueuosine reductase QueG
MTDKEREELQERVKQQIAKDMDFLHETVRELVERFTVAEIEAEIDREVAYQKENGG